MPRNPDDERRGETPRTDLPPEVDPYYDGYFGTEEEEGVEREEELDEEERARRAAEDAAGGGTDVA